MVIPPIMSGWKDQKVLQCSTVTALKVGDNNYSKQKHSDLNQNTLKTKLTLYHSSKHTFDTEIYAAFAPYL